MRSSDPPGLERLASSPPFANRNKASQRYLRPGTCAIAPDDLPGRERCSSEARDRTGGDAAPPGLPGLSAFARRLASEGAQAWRQDGSYAVCLIEVQEVEPSASALADTIRGRRNISPPSREPSTSSLTVTCSRAAREQPRERGDVCASARSSGLRRPGIRRGSYGLARISSGQTARTRAMADTTPGASEREYRGSWDGRRADATAQADKSHGDHLWG
jgi:hypothetical protein